MSCCAKIYGLKFDENLLDSIAMSGEPKIEVIEEAKPEETKAEAKVEAKVEETVEVESDAHDAGECMILFCSISISTFHPTTTPPLHCHRHHQPPIEA